MRLQRSASHRTTVFVCLFPLCSAFRPPRCNLTVLCCALHISWRAFASCMVYAAHLRVRRALVHCSVSYQRGRWRFYHSTGDTPVSSGAPRRRMRRRLVPFSTQRVRHEYCGMHAAFHAATPLFAHPFSFKRCSYHLGTLLSTILAHVENLRCGCYAALWLGHACCCSCAR